MLLTVLSFIGALVLLIAVHEYGHYRVAVACGVKVLRFSIGFGKPICAFRRTAEGTEFVVAAIPLGGYVQMLDEREQVVPAHELHRSFNRQPLKKRAAIVAAGPAANLLLAVLLYSMANWIGIEQPVARIASPPALTLASMAGLQGGELVHSVGLVGGQKDAVQSFEDLRWQLTQSLIEGRDLELHWVGQDRREGHSVLQLSTLKDRDASPEALLQTGINAPWSPAVIGDVMPGSAAARASLEPGDHVLAVNGVPIRDAAHLRLVIRQGAATEAGLQQNWRIARSSVEHVLRVHLDAVESAEGMMGRVGAYIGASPEVVRVQKTFWRGLQDGVEKTWQVSALSLHTLWQMLVGRASLDNLSGPLSIADYAGKSASLGAVQYLLFLALISVSLGVLNLLPLPVLDGGHLMYYLWEGVTGHPVSDVWMAHLQRVGIGLLLVMMSIAFFNDISRIWG